MKKMVMREYEDVMNMLREIIMYQYEQSPNAVAFFRQQVRAGGLFDDECMICNVLTPICVSLAGLGGCSMLGI